MKNLMIIYEVMKPRINGKWEESFCDDLSKVCNRYHTSIVGKKMFPNSEYLYIELSTV